MVVWPKVVKWTALNFHRSVKIPSDGRRVKLAHTIAIIARNRNQPKAVWQSLKKHSATNDLITHTHTHILHTNCTHVAQWCRVRIRNLKGTPCTEIQVPPPGSHTFENVRTQPSLTIIRHSNREQRGVPLVNLILRQKAGNGRYWSWNVMTTLTK